MRFSKESRREVGINIAPLVDVVFLLVIFFAVTTTFLDTAGLELELPDSSSRADRKPESLTLFVDVDGRIGFGDEVYDTAEDVRSPLEAALADQGDEGDRYVVLRGDRAVDYGVVVELMDVVKAAGADGIKMDAQTADPRQRAGDS